MHRHTIGQSDGEALNPKQNIYFQGSEDIWKKGQNGQEGLLWYMSSGYDTAFMKSLQLLFPVQD